MGIGGLWRNRRDDNINVCETLFRMGILQGGEDTNIVNIKRISDSEVWVKLDSRKTVSKIYNLRPNSRRNPLLIWKGDTDYSQKMMQKKMDLWVREKNKKQTQKT